MLALAAIAGAAVKPSNGNFEQGNLDGWRDANSHEGKWRVYRGTAVPDFYTKARTAARGGTMFTKFYAPPQGKYAARTIQREESRQILYRSLEIPKDAQTKLSFFAYYKDASEDFANPATLDVAGDPNQQFRIDVLRKGAPLLSMDDKDILRTPLRTEPGDPHRLKPKRFRINLSAFAGKTVRLRFAVVVTRSFLMAGVDAVRLHVDPD